MGWWDERVDGLKANADRAAEAWANATSKRGPTTAADSKADGGSDGSGLGPVLAIVGESGLGEVGTSWTGERRALRQRACLSTTLSLSCSLLFISLGAVAATVAFRREGHRLDEGKVRELPVVGRPLAAALRAARRATAGAGGGGPSRRAPPAAAAAKAALARKEAAAAKAAPAPAPAAPAAAAKAAVADTKAAAS